MWNTYELDLVNYQNKCRLIRGWDDLFNKVKEHINSVSAMKLSPYYKVCLLGRLLAGQISVPPLQYFRTGEVLAFQNMSQMTFLGSQSSFLSEL